MGEHNFAAGQEMTMSSVIRNYLRWFELNRSKRALRKGSPHRTQTPPLAADSYSPPSRGVICILPLCRFFSTHHFGHCGSCAEANSRRN